MYMRKYTLTAKNGGLENVILKKISHCVMTHTTSHMQFSSNLLTIKTIIV